MGYRKVLVLEPDEDETARRICLCLAQATAVGLRKLGLSAAGGMTGNLVVISIDEVDVTHVDGSWVYGPRESIQRFRDTVKGLAIQVLDAVQTSMSARGYPSTEERDPQLSHRSAEDAVAVAPLLVGLVEKPVMQDGSRRVRPVARHEPGEEERDRCEVGPETRWQSEGLLSFP